MTQTTQVVHTGQKWKHNEHGSTFSVVNLSLQGGDEALVGLSGPLPCRAYMMITVDELFDQYELVASIRP